MKKNRLLFLLIFLLLWIPFVTSCEKEEVPEVPNVEITKYEIIFNTMGGTSIENQQVEENGLVQKPKDPVRTGYIFSGWYTDAEYKNIFSFETKITSNKTLYARWTNEEPEPIKLGTPVVQISSTGIATWQAIEHASGYLCKVNGVESSEIIEHTSIELEDGDSLAVKAVGKDAYVDSDYSQVVTYEKEEEPKPVKLGTPVVQISSTGIATWQAIEHASGYLCKVNGVESSEIIEHTSIELEDGVSLAVKAVGKDAYVDSDYSQVVTYEKEEEPKPIKLGTPVVQISSTGIATWQAIEHASGYLCKVNGVESSEIIEHTSIELEAGDSLAVKAVGKDSYLDSDYSQIVTYEKKEEPHQHKDDNSDGFCDSCNESIVVNLTFFAINDLHGKYMDTTTQPGVDELTTYFKQLYADESSYEVVLSSGDMWQGTVESSSNKGALMTQWMSEAGFASMTVGNHEFDWGLNPFTTNQALADFPFLGINVKYQGQQPDFVKSSTVVTCGSVKIGIIGAIGNCLSSISGEHRAGLSFATGNELTALVKAESKRLRTEEDCDLIIYSLHDGYGQSSSSLMQFGADQFDDGEGHIYYDMELSNGYVDLVFEAHTHQSYIIKDGYGIYHLQGGGENYAISQADIVYNTLTHEFEVTPSKLSQYVYGSSSITDDPVVEQIFNQYFPDNNPYVTVLGFNSMTRSSRDICSQVAKLYYEIGKETWGNNYDIVLGGGFLNTRSPYDLDYGNVTYADIFSLLPFDNEIVLGTISGDNLLNQFINNTKYYCAYDESILNTIDPSQTYYIVVDTYCSTYSRNGITEVKRLSRYSRDLLADFIKADGWNEADNQYHTISVAEALEIGNALALGEQTTQAYYVSGTIQSIVNTIYGNLYLEDGYDSIYVYGCYDQSGNRFDSMLFPPQEGNQIIVYGVIKKYSKGNTYIIELLNVKVIEIIE